MTDVTQWFENGEKPVHIGPYERQGFGFGDVCYTYWGGEHFGYVGKTPDEAVAVWKETNGRKSYHQNRPWRGVNQSGNQQEQ